MVEDRFENNNLAGRTVQIEEVNIPKEIAEKNPDLALQLEKSERDNSMLGLAVGVICLILGFSLIVAGVTGAIDWTFKGLGLESKLAKASPGVVLAVAGVAIIGWTRYRYTIK